MLLVLVRLLYGLSSGARFARSLAVWSVCARSALLVMLSMILGCLSGHLGVCVVCLVRSGSAGASLRLGLLLSALLFEFVLSLVRITGPSKQRTPGQPRRPRVCFCLST